MGFGFFSRKKLLKCLLDKKKSCTFAAQNRRGVAVLPNSITVSTPVFGTEDPGSIPG